MIRSLLESDLICTTGTASTTGTKKRRGERYRKVRNEARKIGAAGKRGIPPRYRFMRNANTWSGSTPAGGGNLRGSDERTHPAGASALIIAP